MSKLTYIRCGDYDIPNLKLSEQPETSFGSCPTVEKTPFFISSARIRAFLASISAFFFALILSSYRFCAPLAFRFK